MEDGPSTAVPARGSSCLRILDRSFVRAVNRLLGCLGRSPRSALAGTQHTLTRHPVARMGVVGRDETLPLIPFEMRCALATNTPPNEEDHLPFRTTGDVREWSIPGERRCTEPDMPMEA